MTPLVGSRAALGDLAGLSFRSRAKLRVSCFPGAWPAGAPVRDQLRAATHVDHRSPWSLRRRGPSFALCTFRPPVNHLLVEPAVHVGFAVAEMAAHAPGSWPDPAVSPLIQGAEGHLKGLTQLLRTHQPVHKPTPLSKR